MMNWLIFMITGLMMLYGVLYIKIFIEVEYHRQASNDNLLIKVYLLRSLLVYQLNIPVMEMVYDKNLVWLETSLQAETMTKTHTKQEIHSFKKILLIYLKYPHKLKRLIRLIKQFTRVYRRIMNLLSTNLICEKFYWRTCCGLQDAGNAGLLAGYLWTIKNLMLVKLSHKFSFAERPTIVVIPKFNQEIFAMTFHCIFSLRAGNVMSVVLSLFYIRRG